MIFPLVHRGVPQLDPAAVPSIFHGAPTYLSTPRTPIRTSPSKRKRLAQEHEECLQETWLDIQKINGYQQLTTNIEMRIRTEFPAIDLVVRQYDNHILVYTLSDAENIHRLPTIRFALCILEDMYMMLFINGILIHTSQLAWITGHTNNVLTLWTQLFEIIRRFKTVPEPDIVSESISLVDSIKSIGTDLDKENTFNFLAEQLQLFTVSPNRRRYSVDTPSASIYSVQQI